MSAWKCLQQKFVWNRTENLFCKRVCNSGGYRWRQMVKIGERLMWKARYSSLSPLLFLLDVVSFSLILKKLNACYLWVKKEYKLNHLLFMDDLKLYAKSEEQEKTLVGTVHVFSTDIGMEFGIRKCGILTTKRGKKS